MNVPRKLTLEKPVKLIFAGGFLGSGKTTALAGLAKGLIQKGMRVGIITNDQTENLADTLIIREMLKGLGVPVEEVVKGCFCCKFDELIHQVEKILSHRPDVLMGEPVGSCTDFVAAVANPMKIHYREAFQFAPFSILVDPLRVSELLLKETDTLFPEEVSYLYQKQLEEADIILLNKVDLLTDQAKERLLSLLRERFTEKIVAPLSAKRGDGMGEWLDQLLSGRPGANTVLGQIDYDRYAKAEAVLGWLNASVQLHGNEPFDSTEFARSLAFTLKGHFQDIGAEIGHLKFVMMSKGRSMWANVTQIASEPTFSGEPIGPISQCSLILNARVGLQPEVLEDAVRRILHEVAADAKVGYEIQELQCFSPAYPQPPYLVRERIEGGESNAYRSDRS